VFVVNGLHEEGGGNPVNLINVLICTGMANYRV